VKARVSEQTLDNLFRKLFRTGWARRHLDLCWHAGEPTVLDAGFYRRAHKILERYRPSSVRVQPSLQTNATLLNKEWCDFFRESGMRVGVSIDGPKRITDLNRVNRAGASAFDRILAGVRLLRSEKIDFHAIAVLSAESLEAPAEIYRFFAEEGIERVAFNCEESEGAHASGLKPGAETWRAFRDFLAEFAALAAADGRVRSVREWEAGFRSIYQGAAYSPQLGDPVALCNPVVEPFSVLSVDHRGRMSTFSPELLGNKSREYDDFIIGDVNADDFADLPQSPNLAKMRAAIAAGVEMCRAQCAYFDVCGGGHPINKLSENGTFASAATEFCRLTRMSIADLVLDGPYGD
jgi:uncharacterized protein